MPDEPVHVVTGALGCSGRYIAARLLAEGRRVRTLTNSPHRPDPFGERIEIHSFHFDEPDRLTESLRGTGVLYNTYWVRFNYTDKHKTFTHADAVANTRLLFQCARDAGVGRVVHVSITNPSADSPLEYFRGKALLETALIDTGLSHAILRPAVLFGREDVLINNIAWALRRLPVFGIFGDGRCRLRPIHVDDLARLTVEQGRLGGNVILNAVGPESFTYRELVRALGRIIRRPRPIVPLPPKFATLATAALGKLLGDILLTREEVAGLMAGLLYVAPPHGLNSPHGLGPSPRPNPRPPLRQRTRPKDRLCVAGR